MAYTPVPTATTGDTFTAAYWNQYVRDNFAAGIPDTFTTKGDLLIATGNKVAAILPIGTDGLSLIADSSQTTGINWGVPPYFSLITKIIVSTPTPLVTISNIPATYLHLKLYIDGQAVPYATEANDWVYAIINNDSGANYSYDTSQFNTVGHYSGDIETDTSFILGTIASSYNGNLKTGQIRALFNNYTNTTFYKLISVDSGDISQNYANAVWWKNTAAINRLDFVQGTHGLNFLAGTTFTLYGF